MQSYCKECVNAAHNKKQEHEPEDTYMKPLETFETFEDIIDSIREREEKWKQDIALLKEENKTLQEQTKDLSRLTESEIRTILSSCTIPLRYLFEAISRLSGDKYSFFAFDKELGMTIPIKTKEGVAAYYLKSA